MSTRRTGGGSGHPFTGDGDDDAREEAEETRIDDGRAIGGRPTSQSRGLSSEGLAIDVDMEPDPEATAPAAPLSASEQTYKLPQRLGRYTLTKLLGIGGMAEVFLAEQAGVAGFKKTCVVKRMLRHLAIEPRFVDMFLREAHLASTLHHPNIVQIWDLGEADGSYFIAMEYVDGLPLNLLARSAWRSGRSIPTEVVCCALADAAEGLAAAHERVDEHGAPSPIIHRDISPDNLMIGRDGVTKILDFGIARIGTGERTSTGELKGKVPFMAPELLRGKAVDGRADLYSLGVTAYWLLTGKRPFTGATDLLTMQSILADMPPAPADVNRGVPLDLNDLVMRLLEKDPSQRVATAREVAHSLEDTLSKRRSVVAPFVRTIFDLPQRANPDEPISQTSGFLPSTPHTDSLKVGRLFVQGGLGPTDIHGQREVSGSGPRRQPPTAHELATVGRAPAQSQGAALNAQLDDPTAGDQRTASGEGDSSVRTQPPTTGPWAAPIDPLAHAHTDVQLSSTARRIPYPALVGVALGLACVVGLSAVMASRSAPPSDAALADAGTPPPSTSPPRTATTPPLDQLQPTDVVVDAGRPSDVVAVIADAGAPPVASEGEPEERAVDREEKGRSTGSRTRTKREPPAKQEVTVKGPADVQWLADGRRVGSGSGTVQVPAGASTLVAWDKKRGVKTTVPIGSGAIDYSKLPRGKLQPRVKPFAEVFLGQESLGTTPFAAVDVVAGTYSVRFVYKDKEQVKSIEVTAGTVVRPLVDFTAAP